ncbi:hypothetical protein NST21_13660 [Peribacillus sp. FSL K6-1552]|uniref:hypothetical protein n=1 Tax=Peribacillus TaxID=2675229 RepID=UPI0030F60600
MPGMENETYIEYKKLEEEWNKHIKQTANCERFVLLVEELVGSHLNQVQDQRAIIKYWLDFMNYMSKEEIVNVAKHYIMNETKLDHLDDITYNISKKWNEKGNFTSLKEVLNEMSFVLKESRMEMMNNEINNLKDELKEVKLLFVK